MIFAAAALLIFAHAQQATPGQLASDIQTSKQKVEAQDLKQRKVLAAIYDLNQNMHKTVSEKSKLNNQRAGLEESTQRLTVQLKELDATSAQIKARLVERLRAIHRLGGFSMGRTLLSATSSSTLDRNLKILGLVASHDRDMVNEYRAVRAEMDLKNQKLTARLEHLKEVEVKLKTQEEKMLAEQKLKNKLLDGIRKKRLFAAQTLEDLKKKTQDMSNGDDAALDALFKPSFADAKGKLLTPVDGKVSRNFGPESSQEQAWTISHKGIRFSAATGKPVKAVFDGTVAWTGEIPGLGNALVLDHGDHYYTVLANAGSILVKQGQEVHREQTVATVGSAALEHDSGIYFEIRHFSEPYDPQIWLKGTAL